MDRSRQGVDGKQHLLKETILALIPLCRREVSSFDWQTHQLIDVSTLFQDASRLLDSQEHVSK